MKQLIEEERRIESSWTLVHTESVKLKVTTSIEWKPSEIGAKDLLPSHQLLLSQSWMIQERREGLLLNPKTLTLHILLTSQVSPRVHLRRLEPIRQQLIESLSHDRLDRQPISKIQVEAAEVSWGDGQGNLHVNLEPGVGHRLPWDLHHWKCLIVPRVSTRNNHPLRLDQWHQTGSDLQHPLLHLRLRLSLRQRKHAWCDIISSNEKWSSLFSPLSQLSYKPSEGLSRTICVLNNINHTCMSVCSLSM